MHHKIRIQIRKKIRIQIRKKIRIQIRKKIRIQIRIKIKGKKVEDLDEKVMKYSRWFIGAVCQHASIVVMPRNHGQRGSQLPRYQAALRSQWSTPTPLPRDQHRATTATLPALHHAPSGLLRARNRPTSRPCHTSRTLCDCHAASIALPDIRTTMHANHNR